MLGSAFQSTGFPDIGAATFTRYSDNGQVLTLLVESVQFMANRLEATAWNDDANAPVDEVAGVPWVRVEKYCQFLPPSRLEAHRLASPSVRLATLDDVPMVEVIAQRLRLAADTPHDRHAGTFVVSVASPVHSRHTADS